MDASPTLPLSLLLTVLLVQLPLMLVVPLLLGRWLRRRFDVGWAVFGVGAATFVASQVVHLPLNWAVGLLGPPRALGLLPLPALAAAAGLSAGLCEEVARFAALRFVYRRARGYHAALQFGAGHGGVEAMILGALVALTLVNMLVLRYLPASMLRLSADQSWQAGAAAATFWATPWYMSLLAGLERVFAITSHVLFTVLVMRTVTRGQPAWLLLAIVAHAALDAVAVWSARTLGAVATEGIVGAWAVAALVLVILMREPRPAPAPAPPGAAATP
ncbi:MAG: YhfC family intramembrane metalloprotease [Deltaproteobacteria bacterium]|nr:YhfC family intramembrane metalloprotease [Deltaproteobacteria bacterium]